MFLKSLTLRGFKSFADKTTLDFEPGITVIVGPNGSGKSNIVDALTWVLGTHSPKSLRGGSMSDVIFTGAPGKPALGRTACEITIDNEGASSLPVDFSEVTVSRGMFASGENDYAINGLECRALDVAELLSDTGLGRQNHTIVGQSRLEAVLNAKPEERRAFIEEAAGILKHRRRRERALRKLSQMEGHVERLGDVLRELRRNLRPLERQAEAAAKHAELQAALRDVRRTRAVRELHTLTIAWADERGAQAASDVAIGELSDTVATTRRQETDADEQLAALARASQAANETHFRLANLVERYRGMVGRIDERRRGLVEAVEEPIAGRDPAALRAEADDMAAELAEVERRLEGATTGRLAAEEAQRQAEQARRAHEQAAAAEARRRTEARERLLRWEGEVAALRSSLAQAASEEGRLASQRAGLESREKELDGDMRSVQREIQQLDAQERILSEQLAAAEALARRRDEAAATAARHERELERKRASLEARADALRATSQEATQGARTLIAAADAGELDGVVGPLADHVQVADGMAKAAAAALGSLGDALVVRSRDAAETAVAFVSARKSGRALLLPGLDRPPPVNEHRRRELADLGARPLLDALRAEPALLAALAHALENVYTVEDFEAACRLAERHPDQLFVTPHGEVAGPRGYAGGAATAGSAVLSRAAAEQAEAQLEVVAGDLPRSRRRLADADRAHDAARRELDAAAAAMQESDGLITAAAERLNRLRKEQATCERERGLLTRQSDDLAQEITTQRERLLALETRGVEIDPAPEGPDLEAERLDDALAEAREAEVQARLRAGAIAQQRDELARRAAALNAEADDVERQLAERERRRTRRLAAIERCGELATLAGRGLEQAEASLAQAADERERVEAARSEQHQALGATRVRLRELEEQLAGLTDSRHREELARQQLRHALDAVRARVREQFGEEPDDALAAARAGGEDGPLPGGDERDTTLTEQEERLVRKVGLLGTINPLALEEFKALEERHRFLTEQLEDLRTSRRDLLEVVAAVDERIRDVFAAAFADVADHFERIFSRLFPGGDGRLILTEPDDLLASGVEVEARPPGKRIKRLSLLSGGERSLTALAVLFAIFAARPSPFYVLDEVEAALDDVNLQRFLDVVREFRASSQFIIVTHQKRTMEIADVLYGVSMRGSGVSTVISQRMTEPAAV